MGNDLHDQGRVVGMARIGVVDKGVIPYIITAMVGVVTYFFGWLQAKRKADIDESGLILGKWKELVESHQRDILDLKEEFGAYRKASEIEQVALRKRLSDVEAEFAAFRRESAERERLSDERIKARDEEIAGLRRLIAQNSQSTAYQLSGKQNAPDAQMQESMARLDRMGDNSNPKGDGK